MIRQRNSAGSHLGENARRDGPAATVFGVCQMPLDALRE